MLTISQNPPVLYPPAKPLHELKGRWWVAHTKARNEKALAWDLLRREISYFFPMSQRTTFSGGRKRKVMMPLFPSYVFICGDEQARFTAISSDRVCQVIEVKDQTKLVHELGQIEKVLAGKASLDVFPFAAVGKRVRVARGPFMGVAGVVIQRDNVDRLVLSVSMLGRGASMEIDADILEPDADNEVSQRHVH